MKQRLMAAVALLTACVITTTAQQPRQTQTAEAALGAAIHQEEAEGDLEAAIAGYKTFLAQYGSNRPLAAQAQFRLGLVYEKLGSTDARTAYENVLRNYADQRLVAADASRRMAALGSAQRLASGPVARQLKDTDLESVSPDGRSAAVQNKDGSLIVRDLASGRERVLARCEPSEECWVNEMLFSPDSQLIIYEAAARSVRSGARGSWTETLRIISRDGGQPRVIYSSTNASDVLIPCGWTPDGKSILANIEVNNSQDLVLIPTSGGTARLVRHFDDFRADYFKMSPDGRTAAYGARSTPSKPERDLFSLALDTGRETRMMEHPANETAVLGWFPDGERILFTSDRGGTYGIWAARIVDGRAQGEPILIRPDTGEVWPLGFTRKGDFYYGVFEWPREVYVATLDATAGTQVGNLTRLEGRFKGGKMAPAWSPDGDRIAYIQSSTYGVVSSKRLAIQTLSTGDVTLLPLSLKDFDNPVWLPDGRGLIVQGNSAEQGPGLFLVNNLETGALTSLLKQAGQPVVSPDGRRVFYSSGPASEQRTLVARDLVSGVASGAEQKVSTGLFNQFALSPDGRWLAMTRLEAGPTGSPVAVIPSSGGEALTLAPVISTWSIDPAIAWNRDGRQLFVVKIGSNSREVWQVPIDGSAPRNTGIRWSGQKARVDNLSAHPDGRRLALNTTARSWTSWVLQNLP